MKKIKIIQAYKEVKKNNNLDKSIKIIKDLHGQNHKENFYQI
jgi:hypothetical protein